ncbi:MAG TPA: GldG family protein, partial [Cyclobacteriaceae bacterium]|nr:GldG family protein [Cyclobacteriaceae bacterium]
MNQKFVITTLLVIGILIVVNVLSSELHFRLDLTETHQYTLSRATLDILENLEEPVTVKAYFSRNLPAHIGKTRQDFQDLLVEYASRSDGMISYEFIDPNTNEAAEKQAGASGIRPVMINVREKDQVKQQKAFLGATLSLGEKKEVIPFIQPGAAMEYALSTSIKKLSVSSKPVIGFLSGHGEPALSAMEQAVAELSVLYDLQEIRIDSADVPANVKTLAIIAPKDSIPGIQLERIDQFMAR